MRRAFLFTLLAAASFSLAAQQQRDQRPPEKQQEKAAAEERSRIEGAAGGTSPVPEEKRKAVGSGAGPHLKDNLPSPQNLPRDRPVEPSK